MERAQSVELFSGNKVFSSLAQALGYKTFTVDCDDTTEPDLVADIRSLDFSELPKKPLVAWAAPPASAFNQAEMEAHWDRYGGPLTPTAEQAMDCLRATLSTFSAIQPEWWFIENPYGPLRHFTLMAGFNRGYPTRNRMTIDHADYSDQLSFKTDIWTNAFWWQPRREAISRVARRPGNAKVQVIGKFGRRLPAAVISEMFDQLDAYQRSPSQLEYIPPVLNS